MGSCFRQGMKLLSITGTVRGTENLCLCGFQLSSPENFSEVLAFLEPSFLLSDDYEQIEPSCFQLLQEKKDAFAKSILTLLSEYR